MHAKPSNSPVQDRGGFLTTTAAAAFLSLRPSTLATWRSRGRLSGDCSSGPPFFRFGRSVRYRFVDLLRWAETSGPLLHTSNVAQTAVNGVSQARKHQVTTGMTGDWK